MTHDDTTLLLARRVSSEEPTFTLDASLAIASGRRMRSARRRRLGVAVAGAAVTCGVVVGAVMGAGAGFFPDRKEDLVAITSQAPANYDAEAMPQALRGLAAEYLGDGLSGMKETFSATSDGSDALAAGNLDQATSMELSYSNDLNTYVSIYIAHARGYAEGDPADACRDLKEFSPEAVPVCNVTRRGGQSITTEITIHAPMPGTPAKASLWDSLPLADAATVALQGPDLYFTRSVKVIRSETLVTMTREVVRARTLTEAKQNFAWNIDTITGLATDSRLVIPNPRERR